MQTIARSSSDVKVSILNAIRDRHCNIWMVSVLQRVEIASPIRPTRLDSPVKAETRRRDETRSSCMTCAINRHGGCRILEPFNIMLSRQDS